MFGRRKHRPTAAKLERGVRHRRRTSSDFVRKSALVAVIDQLQDIVTGCEGNIKTAGERRM